MNPPLNLPPTKHLNRTNHTRHIHKPYNLRQLNRRRPFNLHASLLHHSNRTKPFSTLLVRFYLRINATQLLQFRRSLIRINTYSRSMQAQTLITTGQSFYSTPGVHSIAKGQCASKRDTLLLRLEHISWHLPIVYQKSEARAVVPG